jgi:hypothetical protein
LVGQYIILEGLNYMEKKDEAVAEVASNTTANNVDKFKSDTRENLHKKRMDRLNGHSPDSHRGGDDNDDKVRSRY